MAYEFDSLVKVKIWVIKNQFHRRNLSEFQRIELAYELEPLIAEEAKEQQGTRSDLLPNLAKSNPIHTRKEVAKIAEVSPDLFFLLCITYYFRIYLFSLRI